MSFLADGCNDLGTFCTRSPAVRWAIPLPEPVCLRAMGEEQAAEEENAEKKQKKKKQKQKIQKRKEEEEERHQASQREKQTGTETQTQSERASTR